MERRDFGMVQAGSYQLRFYEKDPGVKFTIKLLLAFPDSLQSIIGRGFVQLAEKNYRAQELLSDFKSLGSETVLALYQAKKKRRAYDQIPTVHQAMSYLMILPPEQQRALAAEVTELMDVVQEYLRLCSMHQMMPQRPLLEKLSDIYVHQGQASVKMCLNAIQVEFKARQAAASRQFSIAAGNPDALEIVKDQEHDLKVVENDTS